jgi:hypothetical protein
MLNWLEETYRILKSNVHNYETSTGATELKWQGAVGDYYTHFYDDRLVDIHAVWTVSWGGIKPTGKEVVDCLGKPDLYYAEYGPAPHGYGLLLDLWYLKKELLYVAFILPPSSFTLSNVVYYLHGDHLDSTSLTTDSIGNIVSQAWYLPYGQERWGSTGPTDFGFTLQRSVSAP